MKKSPVDKLKNAEKSPAWKSVECYIVMYTPGFDEDLENLRHGKIKVRHFGSKTEVFVWDSIGTPLQYAACQGIGLNRLNTAMSSITFDDVKFLESGPNWIFQLEKRGYQVIRGM